MDDHTLRDLGVHRSELGSYFAESQQWAEPTRQRIALIIDGQVGEMSASAGAPRSPRPR